MKNIFITGVPGSGKTTLVQKLAQELRALNPIGFYTAEIRERNQRQGFELVSLTGEKALLSHVKIKSTCQVGRYGVNIKNLEFFLKKLDFFNMTARVIIIDEIGKMECFSMIFKELIAALLDAKKPVIATIALKGGSFITQLKKRDDTKIFTVTRENRNFLPGEILQYINSTKSFHRGD